MSKENKIKKLKKSQNSSYRLAVMKEDSYQEKFALSLKFISIFYCTNFLNSVHYSKVFNHL